MLLYPTRAPPYKPSVSETAARDRLGKGQKIEVKPLTGIVEKLKQRRALAVARAPKLRAEAAPSFDDVLAAAAERTPAKAPRPATNEGEAAEPGNAALEAGGSTPVPDVDAEADLELISVDDGDGGGADGFTVVDLPSAVKAAPKPSPLAFLPFTDSRELDEFEEEALIDDGAGLDDESDSESERSWEVRRADDAAEGEGAESKENQEKDAGGSGESDSEDDSDLDDEEDGEDGEESGAGMAVDGVDGEPAVHPTSDQGRTAATDLDATAKPPVPSAAVLLGAAQPVTKRAQRLQRAYLDTEAELSDEDAAAVSEDEADDDVDDRGELADLIATGKAAAVGAKEKDVAEMLHVQWAQQQDVKELQNVLKGLENGFRRRGGAGALADMDDDMDGRRRRARDMDDDLLLGGGLMWPSAFGALGGGNGGDDDDECEDEAMLQRAKQQRLLASSQVRG